MEKGGRIACMFVSWGWLQTDSCILWGGHQDDVFVDFGDGPNRKLHFGGQPDVF